MPARARPLPRLARYTWGRQWPAVLLVGFSLGIFQLATFAAKRSLGAAKEHVALLVALWQVSWIFAPALGPLLSRVHPQRAWRWIGVLQHVPVLLIAFVAVRPLGAEGRGAGDLGLFIAALFVYYLFGIVAVPHRGALLRANYAPEVRGRMYGFLQGLTIVGVMGAAWASGRLLDRDPRWLRVIFPLAGLLGMAGYLLLSRIRWRGQRRTLVRPSAATTAWQAWRAAWRETFRILRDDRAFRTYEAAFMIYGFGFLMSVPLLVLYAESRLGLSYTEWTRAQMFAFPVAQICGLALWGRLADRLGVVRTTGLAFLLLAAFFCVMPAVGSALGLMAAFLLFGLAMAGVDVGWSIGPLHFAPDGMGHLYMAMHFAFVGVRSLFAPFLGYQVQELFSYRVAFTLSAGLLVAGAVTVWRLARRSARPGLS